MYDKGGCENTAEQKSTKTAAPKEILGFWTDILRSDESDLKDKLKVSEYLAKGLGVFSEAGKEEKPKSDEEKMSLKEKLEYIEKLKSQ